MLTWVISRHFSWQGLQCLWLRVQGFQSSALFCCYTGEEGMSQWGLGDLCLLPAHTAGHGTWGRHLACNLLSSALSCCTEEGRGKFPSAPAQQESKWGLEEPCWAEGSPCSGGTVNPLPGCEELAPRITVPTIPRMGVTYLIHFRWGF